MAADQEPGPLVQFRASDLYGQETVVECRPTDLVSAFCLRYEELKPHNQDALKTRFLYEGIELEKNMTLQSYNIDPAKPILVLNGPRSADENAPQAKAPNNYLIIITLYGWQTCVPIYDGDTTEILKLRIEALEGVPFDQQRVIANGKQLEDHRELNDYGLTTDGTSVAHLVLRLRGDIGLWDTHQDSWLASALHKNAVADVPRDQVSEMVRVLKEQKGMALPSNASARKSESAELLSAPQREALIQQIDLALSDPATANTDWGAVTATSYGQFMRNRNDSQLFLKPVDIDRLLGVGTCDKLREAFGDSFNEVKVRRVVANDTCINFHLDYSLKTMAIPLNPSSEFKGGAIVFANEDGQLDMPSRAPGHPLIHDNTWVHGVTRLSEGVRYSVFFLKTEEASA